MSIFAPTPEMVAAMRAHFAQKESATTPAYTPIVFNAKEHSHLLSSFVDIHIACVQHDDLIATFLPPFTDEKRAKMTKWWQAQFDETEKDERVIVMIMGRASEADVVPSDGPIAEYKYESSAMASAHAASPAQGQILAGYVMLVKPFTETGPFRGPVEKLLISPRFRRRGLARKIMEKLEVVAREAGKTLLLLDTVTGSPAEEVYRRLGYTQYGFLADYGVLPSDKSKLGGGTWFYKDLRRAPVLSESR